ncbi:amino acid adenylation domain-containing protein [Archangium violaceum]|uniref:amino acid adenylation domain-containing protein n=1 Tax=Archangium violaceum TaxID=83451 RepID=UPI0036D8AB22
MSTKARDRIAALSPEKQDELMRKLREKNARAKPPAIPPRPKGAASAPLSFAQQRLWFLDQLEPGSATYNLPAAVRLEGVLDVAALERAFAELARRHESLRTAFQASEGGAGVQVVSESAAPPLRRVDLRELPTERREAEALRFATEELRRPFELSTGPLLRASLVKLAEQEHVLVLVMHHIVSDGWSLGVLIRELALLYTAFSRGQPSPLPEPTLQYADFACWQREWLEGEVLETQLAYWKEQLDGVPQVLELPTDRPRPPVQSYRGASHPVRLSRELSEAIKELGKQEGATPFMVLLAGFGVLLRRYAGQDDFCIGTPIAGRNRTELEGLIGFFINTLALRFQAGETVTFRELLARVKKTTVKAYAHQELPFEKLVDTLQPERDLSRSPLFQVLFTLQNAPMPVVSQPGFTLRPVEVENTTAKFDLSLSLGDGPEGFAGSLDYSVALFDASTAARMMEHLKLLLEGLVARPDQRLGDLALVSENERRRLLVEWNDTKRELPREACAHRLFEAQAARTPHASAVAFGEEVLTYAELDQRANRLAHHLCSLGVGPETRVGLCLERSLDFPIAMLAILKAGGAFVPLDPSYPAARLAFVLADAGISLLVTHPGLLATPPEGIQRVCLDADAHQALANLPGTAPDSGVTGDNLAYVLYTSGSTGTPKGALLHHLGLCNTALAAVTAHRFRPDSRVLQFASPAFDASVCEVFSSLLAGACLVLAPRDELLPELPLRTLLEKQAITAVTLTPSVLAQLSEEGLPRLETLISAGEALPPSVARRWSKGRTLLNAYGPTEVTVCASISGPVDPERLSIGRPFPNVELYVLDERLRPVPTGVPGELFVGGVGLARGYLGRPELTAERFLPHPFSSSPGSRLYRTGDRVRFLSDGQLEFLGRSDSQVKVRGFRIEPGEVEASLLLHPSVREAVVVVREDVPGLKRLVAYVTGEAQALGPESLRAFLKERLPEHLVPAAFVALPALPLTSSGKVDRKALPAPDARPELKQSFVAPRDDVEQKLATVWAQVLGLKQVGVHDNFFELGGDSISTLQIISRARQVGLHLSPKQIFQRQTIAELAPLATVGRAIQSEQGVVVGPVPLTPIQQAFFESGLPRPHHFNQSLLLETREPVDSALLERALGALVRHHDALRMRFVQEDGPWRQINAGLERSASVPRIDLSSVPEAGQAAALEAEATRIQGSFDLSEGLLLRAALFDRGPQRTGRLLLVAHHLVVDTVSWRTLLEDLDGAYRSLRQGKEPALPPKTTSFKAWAERLEAHARSEALEAQLPFWCSESRQQVRPLPVDLPGGANTLASLRMVKAELDAAETRLLLQEVPSAYRARINDVLLTALARACATWTGQPRLLVDLEGHGREELFEDVDLSRTVGWFTSVTPVLLEVPASASPGDTLRSVRDGLRQIPAGGLGYGLLRYLGRDEVARKMGALPKAQVAFNYLGQMDAAANSSPLFGLARESSGSERGPGAERGHLLEVSAVVIDGQLRLSFSYSQHLHAEATLQGLAQAFLASLRELISGRTGPDALRYTPADFPLARLPAEDLDRTLPPATPIEDLYPLSPLQQGMLFHTLLAPSAGFYFEQMSWAFHSPIELPVFRRAWDALVEQHAILRTGFFWEGLAEPLQVVYARAALPYEEHDWRGLSRGEQQEKLAAFIAADRARGFDLRRPPLIRLAVMRLEENVLQFVWSHHHLLMDGWSIGLLLNELFARYEELLAGKQRVNRSPPFRDYIEWLQQQPQDRAEAYWRQTLQGFTTPTPLPAAKPTPAGALVRSKERRKLFLTPAATAALQSFARQHQLTLNTLVQGTWALLLGRYSGESDVLFGTIVSGRPPELAGVEQMIGLFINSVPVRVRVPDEETILPWLQRLQAQQLERGRYEYTPLLRIQGWSQVPRGTALFDSLLVFENYPVDGAVRERGSRFDARDIESFEHNNFPLDAAVTLGPRLGLHVTYDTARFDDVTIEQLLGHWAAALEDVIVRPERRLSEVSLLPPEERQRVLVEWNATSADYPRHSTIHELFEAQAAQHPDSVAVESGSLKLTYRQLDERSNQLAHSLRRLGVGPDSRVALCLERSLELIVSLLAILKAGGAYVPLDSSYPRQRLSLMLADAQPQVLVTTRALLPSLPADGLDCVLLDEVHEALARESTAPVRSGALPQHLAYIDFTSGSTGRPKGVCIEHRSVLRTLLGVSYAHLGPEHSFLLLAPISFDASTLEVWGPLLHGARLVLFPPHSPTDVHELADVLSRHHVTTLHLTSGLFTQVVDSHLEALRPLQQLLTGGDVVSAPHVQRVLETLRIPVTACYGPTEGTLFSSCLLMTQPSDVGASVPIGRPISNTQLYVLDSHLQPVPPGVPGELFISGDGLARGYLGASSLTAERFLPNPFSSSPGARMYRTGDLARHRHDGVLEFLGRLDSQVKVRGFRIELSEVESALLSLPGVREAVALAREDSPGLKRLVAYFTGDSLSPESLRSSLQQRLPEYMVPSSFVHLPALPLTSHGKVDRKALPAPDSRPELSQSFLPPRNDIERTLSSIWAEVLHLERVGVLDNFFELGGHSLLATQAISRIRTAFAVELPLRDLFDAPTIAALAPRIHAALQSRQGFKAPPLLPVPRTGRLPLSFAQQRLFFLDQLEPNNPAYNMPTALRLEGTLDLAALERSFNELVRRHESLRTTFRGEPKGATQVIAPAVPLPLPVVDLSGLPEAERESEARRLAIHETQRPFDLARGPLLRTQLLRLNDTTHVLLVTMHHIISDGWSMTLLTREMGQLYAAYSTGRPSPLPELAVQYADYAAWQQGWLVGEVLDAQLSYWREQLAGVSQVLELPTDRPRPAVRSHRGATRSTLLPLPLTDRIRELARAEGVTPFMLLLTALEILLQRYSGQDDFVIGTDVANRHHAEVEGLIGFFVNQLALRARLSGDPTFRELLARTRDGVLGAQAHQDLPFEELVRVLNPARSLQHAPLFQVKLTYQNTPQGGAMELPGLTLRGLGTEQEAAVAKLDLTFVAIETPRGLSCVCEYATDLFDADTIGRMFEHLQVLLDAATTQPELRLSSLPLLTQAERQRLLVEWNATHADFPREVCAHTLFEAQARRTPETLAVRFGEVALTYRQLDARANQLAWHLRSLGVGPDMRVGLCVERSLDMVVAILGILKAGGAYVPLDPTYPTERLAFMLRDALIPVLLTHEHLADALPVRGELLVLLDTEWDALIASQPEHAPDVPVPPDHLAYVIYTSGSTGRPKGTLLHHRGLCNTALAAARAKRLHSGSRVLQFASSSFDASVWETFSTLLAGACLVLASREELLPDVPLRTLLEKQAITAVTLTPSVLAQLSEQGLPGLETVVSAGEALPRAVAQRWSRGRTLLNAYGPTEVTVCASISGPVDAERITIGRPFPNVELYVLDALLQPVPVGVPGELYVGGAGLARGYLGQPELTAEKFLPHPFSAEPGARLYRTGDRVRYLPDGQVEFLGRADEQVKLRGFRIELGEVEAALARHPAVREATAVVREDSPGQPRLVAYVVPAEEQSVDVAALRAFLKEHLPEHMVPAAFVPLSTLPLTPSGKVDRKALPAPDGAQPGSRDFIPPRDVLELQLAQLFEELLGTSPVGVRSQFFELGGHSLLAVQLLQRIEQITGQSVPLAALFEDATVEHLARLLRQEPRPWTPLVPLGRAEGGRPFFCVHPVGGNVLCYVELARALGPGLRFHGLQAPGLDGEQPPLESVEALAALYVAAVRTVQPSGPYLLGGWSLGGNIALEMAQLLQQQGERVDMLTIIDGYAGFPEGLLPPEDTAAVMTALFARNLAAISGEDVGTSNEALEGMGPDEQLQHLLDEGRKSSVVTPDTELTRMRALRQVFANNVQAGAKYRPRPYSGPVTLLRASESGNDPVAQAESWKRVAGEGVQVHDLPGDHYSVLRAPHVQLLAQRLQEVLEHLRSADDEEQARRHA